MRILFRCDGGSIPEIGTGHLVRCLLLADRLREEGHAVAFAVARDRSAAARVREKGYRVFALSAERPFDGGELSRALHFFRADAAVIDCLTTPRGYLAGLKKKGRVVVTLDNLASDSASADVTVNAMISGGIDTPYRGYPYIILPPRDIQKKKIAPCARRVFASFGGYDHGGLASKTLEAVPQTGGKSRFVVVAGQNGRDVSGSGSPERVRLYSRVEDFDGMVERSDMALLAAGLSVYQALSSGTPAMVISQYPHQEETARKLASAGAAIDLGSARRITPRRIARSIERLAGDPELRRRLSLRGQCLVDRGGLERVANLIQAVRFLPWDTAFFKKRIARFYPFRLTRPLLDLAFDYCRAHKIDCLYYLADCHHPESVRLAEENGFHFVDLRLTFRLDLTRGETPSRSASASGVTVRDFRPGDLAPLRKIARTNYTMSRYFFDHRFPDEACARFYSDWIAKCARGASKKVWVAVWRGEVAGYVTCDAQDPVRGTLSLVGVRDRFQGRGIGKVLVGRAVRWFREAGYQQLEVVTQGRNYAAQRLYQHCGFATGETQIWYHKWFER